MNRTTMCNQKVMILLAMFMTLTVMLVGCKQEAPQEPQATETMVATEVPVTTVPEETTMPEEIEVIITIPEVEAPEAGSITYAEYLELSAEEQQAYYENFDTVDAFFKWMDAAKAEYEAAVKENVADENPAETESEFFLEEGVEDLE